MMERARDPFLARSRLATEEHGHVARRHPPDGLVDLLHGRMPPHQRAELPDLLEAVPERGHFLGEPPRGEGPLREQERLVEVEGLGEIVVGALLHRLDRRLHRPVGGHDHHLGIGTLRADLGEEGEAVEPRHADIEKDQIERLGFGLAESRRAVLHRGDLIAGAAEALLKDPAEAVFVVGDEDASIRHGGHSTLAPYLAMGRKHEKAVPTPVSLATWMEPLCSSTMRWQRARPSPRPRSLVVKKGVKRRSRVAAGIPCPSSTTWISALVPRPCPTSP